MATKKIRLELTEEQFMKLYREAPKDSYLYHLLDEKLNAMAKRTIDIEEHNKKEGLRHWT
ncbi:hypothetical protein SAMN05421493_1402 [Pseudobutyrivibrio sp. 49]|uniref:hypothetical protein n=1 Tax=Lachnospiraceae TaxID=186803 RepID=UPI00088B8844|nr:MULTISPECIES: hypothetical protein [Lachnospiraceae]SDI88858.1 hypothetical protein SAMN05421493_1402 [Pseudobutyrivibrio sp. 49]